MFTFSDYGEKVKSFMDKGDLVPDDIVTKLIFSELANKTETSWLLDGGCSLSSLLCESFSF